MKILAFDSTAPTLTLGLAEGDHSLGCWSAPARRSRGNTLEALIEQALAEAGWTRQSVDGLALVLGPGSLTAMRIGWATAAGWAHAGGIPIAGWSTPAVQYRYWFGPSETRPKSPLNPGQPVHCLVHHRGEEFYCYAMGAQAPPSSPEVVQIDNFSPPAGATLVGPGLLNHRQRWEELSGNGVRLIDEAQAVVPGDVLALWGHLDLEAGRVLPLDDPPLDYGLAPDFRKRRRP